MAEKKKVRVTIGGINYSLITDETAEYTHQIAEEIDTHMKELMGSNPFISSNQAAVLLAIEYIDKAKKAEQLVETYRSQIKDYLKDTSEMQTERDFYKRELDRLRTEEKAKSDQINFFTQVEEKPEVKTTVKAEVKAEEAKKEVEEVKEAEAPAVETKTDDAE